MKPLVVLVLARRRGPRDGEQRRCQTDCLLGLRRPVRSARGRVSAIITRMPMHEVNGWGAAANCCACW
jgi:hypothetical protein